MRTPTRIKISDLDVSDDDGDGGENGDTIIDLTGDSPAVKHRSVVNPRHKPSFKTKAIQSEPQRPTLPLWLSKGKASITLDRRSGSDRHEVVFVAKGELTLDRSAGRLRAGDEVRLSLERHASGALELVGTVANSADQSAWSTNRTECFRGPAGYWLAMDERQQRALVVLAFEDLAVVIAHASEDGERIPYTIGLQPGIWTPARATDAALLRPPPVTAGKVTMAVALLMQWLFPDSLPGGKDLFHGLDVDGQGSWGQAMRFVSGLSADEFSAASVFETLRPDPNAPDDLPALPDEFLPTLRPYQRQAVAWMLEREGGHTRTVLERTARMWTPLIALDGTEFYYNQHSGVLVRNGEPEGMRRLSGGILAEEMGLGKTVEIIALIMLRPWKAVHPELAGPDQGTDPKARDDMLVDDAAEPADDAVQVSERPAGKRPATSAKQRTRAMKRQRNGKAEGLDSVVPVLDQSDDGDEDEGEAELGASPHSKAAAATAAAAAATKAGDDDENEEEKRIIACHCAELDRRNVAGGLIPCRGCNTWHHLACVAPSLEPPFEDADCLCLFCTLHDMFYRAPLRVKGNIVCSPDPIVMQWKEEIDCHTSSGALSVFVYEGVKKTKDRLARAVRARPRANHLRNGISKEVYAASAPLWPCHLASFDVVLTTYSALKSDFYLSAKQGSGNAGHLFLRGGSGKYQPVPSPLNVIVWFRAIMDEAQLVESSSTQAAKVAKHLNAEHRWAVTGTPVGKKGTADLFGLMEFLRHNPLSSPHWWDALVLSDAPYLTQHLVGLSRRGLELPRCSRAARVVLAEHQGGCELAAAHPAAT